MSSLVNEIYAFLILEDGIEGIPAVMTPMGLMMPMVSGDLEKINKLHREMAQRLSNQTGKSIKLVKFSLREELEEVKPEPQIPDAHPSDAVAALKSLGFGEQLEMTKPPACPKCKREIHTMSAVGSDTVPPEVGDLTVCTQCATILRFNAELVLYAVPDDEYKQLPAEDRKNVEIVARAIKEVSEFFKKEPWPKESC